MFRKYSIRHFFGAGLMLSGFNTHQLEAVKSLTTDEAFPHDLIASPLNTPQKIPDMPKLPNEIWLIIFQTPAKDHLELLKNLRLVCRNFKEVIDKNLIAPSWKNKLARENMKKIKEALSPFLKFSEQTKTLLLNIELSKKVLSGLRQLIEKEPFPVTCLAFEGEAWGEKKQNDIQKIFSNLTRTGELEQLKISSSIQWGPLETTPLRFFSNPSLKRNIGSMKALDIFMLKIPGQTPVSFALDLPPSVENLSLETNITFDITQGGTSPKRLKILNIKKSDK